MNPNDPANNPQPYMPAPPLSSTSASSNAGIVGGSGSSPMPPMPSTSPTPQDSAGLPPYSTSPAAPMPPIPPQGASDFSGGMASQPQVGPASSMNQPSFPSNGPSNSIPAVPLYNPGSNSNPGTMSSSFSGQSANSYGPFPPPGASPSGTSLNNSGPSPVPAMPAVGGGPLPPPTGGGGVRQEVIQHLKKANNVLVTVSSSPSVDQLSSAIGITLLLNKLNKHATAVYSGKTPSTLEFLQPEKTIEKNTDSLRDFIIALDKAKADKLRYKVEDQFVKIFITPYHTSINEEDLEFSQGDFNVDVVLALGVHQRTELDQAITAHGRILHDAVTISVNNNKPAELGNLNWFQADASSLCEMLVGLIEPLQGDKALLDNQIATSFLTGVVAETERFSNNKTTPRTMNVSATLMKAGANQQLVATKLQEPEPLPEEFDKTKLDQLAKEKDGAAAAPVPSKDGSLEIEHKPEDSIKKPAKTLAELEKENKQNSDDDSLDEDSNLAKIHIDEQGGLHIAGEEPKAKAKEGEDSANNQPSNMIMEKPAMSGDLSSATREDNPPTAVAAVDMPPSEAEAGNHMKTIEPLPERTSPSTLSDIEAAVNSPHLNKVDNGNTPSADSAREEVKAAGSFSDSQRLEPIAALNATPVDLEKDKAATSAPTPSPVEPAKPKTDDLISEEVFPPQLVGPDKGPGPDPTASSSSEPGSPPPVPPPIIPSS